MLGKRLRRDVDFAEFLKVLHRQGPPRYLPFYEHLATDNFIGRRTETDFEHWPKDHPVYWQTFVDFWLGMGYDCIPLEIPLSIPFQNADDPGGKSHSSESFAVIHNRADFERFPWPDESNPIDFRPFETVGRLIPENIRIAAGVAGGPYEIASHLMGITGISYLLADDPELVRDLFGLLGRLYVSADRQLAAMNAVGALRQGDDLGYKTATFLSPPLLRELVFPIYRQMAAEAHARNKPFILHSCGNLGEVYPDLIQYCKIDAKHSFEDVIMPVEKFQAQYGAQCTPLGGLDVDIICRVDEATLRAYTRRKIEACLEAGRYWALGTGNSLTSYMPVEKYLIVLDEGLRVAGG